MIPKIYTVALTAMFALLSLSVQAQVNYTSNDINPTYNGKYRPGLNLDYLPPWSTEQLGDLAAGNPALGIPGAGARSTRPGLFDSVLDIYGYGLNVGAYDYYRDLGMTELTAIVGFPSDRHRAWADRHCGDPDKWNALFEGIYEPIWDGGANGTPYNEDNAYAAYLYQIVTLYTDHVRFWEIWNEPGLYKGNDSQVFWGDPSYPGSWWVNDPDPCDYSIHAPIEHFIRTLRISYEIIKTISPDDYVAIAGVGSQSFLDAILRNTDNPDDGSITAEFPNLGGAYIDVLGFHTYPHLDGSTWFPPTGHFARHSDGAADGIINRRLGGYQQVLYNYGYDGITYPKKQHICTEINVPRRIYTGDYFGGNDEQINFIPKALIATKINKVHQMHVYSISDKTEEWAAGFEFDLMGLYKKLEGVTPFNQELNDEGIAYKTVADLIYPTEYDEAATQALNAPAGVRAYAFAKPNGEYVYALWAETQIDLSEQASANYSFPAGLGLDDLTRYNWNHSQTGQTSLQSPSNIQLDARPIYLVSGDVNSSNTAPTPTLTTANTTVDAAFDVTITFDEPVSGLAAADFQLVRARLLTLIGTGTTYTATFEPTAQGTVTIQLPAGAAVDAENLGSLASNLLTLTSTTDGGNSGGMDADVELVMTADRNVAGLYENVTFTVVASNTGQREANNIIVEFPFPMDLSYVDAVADQGSYAPWSANWDVGTLAPGATASLDLTLFTLTTDARTAFAQVINMTQFDADSTPGNGACCTANEDDEAAYTINGSGPPAQMADLALSLASPQTAVSANGDFDLVLTVNNDGPDPTSGVQVQLELPAGLTTTGANIPPGTQLNNAVWTVNRLNVGESQTLELSLRTNDPSAGAVVTAEVIASAQPDPDSAPNNGAPGEDDRGVLVLDGAAPPPLGDAALTLTADRTVLRRYQPITFTLTMSNDGTAPVTDVEIHFPKPAGLVYTDHMASEGNYNAFFDRWSIASLAPGESAELDLTLMPMRRTTAVTAFAQVVAMRGGDSDSSPNNRICCTAIEDDEASLRIQSTIIVRGPTRNNNPALTDEGAPEAELQDEPANTEPVFIVHRIETSAGSGARRLNFTTTQERTEATLVDALGRPVQHLVLATEVGTHQVDLPLDELAPGTYTLLVATAQGAQPIRLVNTK